MTPEELREAARFMRDAVAGGTPNLDTAGAREHMGRIAERLAHELDCEASIREPDPPVLRVEYDSALVTVLLYWRQEHARRCAFLKETDAGELALSEQGREHDDRARDDARALLRAAEVYDARGCPLCLS